MDPALACERGGRKGRRQIPAFAVHGDEAAGGPLLGTEVRNGAARPPPSLTLAQTQGSSL